MKSGVLAAVAGTKALLVGPVWTTVKATVVAAATKLSSSSIPAAVGKVVSSTLFQTLLQIVWAFAAAGLGDAGEPYIAAAKVAIGWTIW